MDCFPAANPSSSSGSSLVPNINGQKKKKKGSKRSNNNGVMKLSTDPQSVAARERRHRISDRFKILQSMVPGGTKLDTVSMLEEAINYVKFLKAQILFHQAIMNLDHDHHHSEPSPNILPAAGYALLPLEQPSYLDANNVLPGSVQPSVSLPVLPQAGSSYPVDQQGMHWDPFDNN